LQSQFNNRTEETSTEPSGDTSLSATVFFSRVPSELQRSPEEQREGALTRKPATSDVVTPAESHSIQVSPNEAPSPPATESAVAPQLSRDRHVDLTGVFRQVAIEKPRSATSIFAGPAPSEPQDDAALGFTQIFQALSQPEATSGGGTRRNAQTLQRVSEEEKALHAEWNQGAHRGGIGTDRRDDMPAIAKPPAPGEFTSLFSRLENEGARPASVSEHMQPVRPAPDATPQFGGGFTQLLRTLSAEEPDVLARPGAPAPYPSTAPSPSGPGEFTRIISGSMLREAQGRSTIPNANIAQAERASHNGAAPSEASPTPLPAAPASPPPQATPPAVTPEQLMRMQNPTPAPSPLTAAPGLAAPTPAAPQPPAPSRLQQNMPLLLIANLFVTLVLLVVVIVLVLRR